MRRSAAVAANRNDRLIQDKRHILQIQQCIGDITRGEHVHAAQYNGPHKSAQLVVHGDTKALYILSGLYIKRGYFYIK